LRLLLVFIGVCCIAVVTWSIATGNGEALEAVTALLSIVVAIFSIRVDLRELWRAGHAPPPGGGRLVRAVRRLLAGVTSTVRWQDLGRVTVVTALVVVALMPPWGDRDGGGACTGPEVHDVSPPDRATVRARTTFTGTTACLADDDIAYVVVFPEEFPGYYPQGNGIHHNGKWNQSVTFGGRQGHTYSVFVVVPDEADRQAIEDATSSNQAIGDLPGSDFIYQGTYAQ